MKPLGRWASPLARVYGAVVDAKNSQFDSGARPALQLRGPVVSVGNLAAGGTGKTPFVMLLAELLHARGIAVDVLSRGYRRKSSGVRAVDPRGTAAEFGDEPLLMARRLERLGIPVMVGEKRVEAGLFAEKSYGVRLHLLDDGFQHRQLARDVDIVMVSEEDITEPLLPAGRLREPVTALERADVAVGEKKTNFTRFPYAPHGRWRTVRTQVVEHVGAKADGPPPAHAVAFCGIGRPEAFFAQLAETGVHTVGVRAFANHHAYRPHDVAGLKRLAMQSQAEGFITTEKDLVNLGALAAELRPLWVARLQVELCHEQQCLEQLVQRLAALGRPAPLRSGESNPLKLL